MKNFQVPPGQATGCLPRTTRYGECCAKLEDEFNIISDEYLLRQHIEAPREEKLLSCVWEWLSQGRVGSCGAEAATNAMLVSREFSGAPRTRLNPWSVYQETSDKRDRGSSVSENLRYTLDFGILPMELWPRSKGWSTTPPKELLETEAPKNRAHEWLDINTIAEIRTALCLNFPIPFGWRGHSCVLLALKSLDTAYYLNSWGKSWSDNEHDWPGIGEIRLKDVDFGYEAWALRSTTDAGVSA